MKKKILTLALMAVATLAMAQDDNVLAVDAQLRTRGEYNNGAIKPRGEGELPSGFVNDRARLSLDYQRNNLEVKMSVQHTGVWGQDDIKGRNGRVAMNEAWAKLKFGKGLFAQIGRQQLAYDDDRILGTLDWNVAGNWHDALRLGYENKADKLHLILAMNQSAENVRGSYYEGKMPYKNMQTAWYHHQFDEAPLGVSLLVMNLGREGGKEGIGKTRYMQTYGTHITYKPENLDLTVAAYAQTGKNTVGQTVAAFMASANVGYAFDNIWKANIGYDYLSGNNGKSSKDKAFDPLYGTHHKFYGHMDYFTGRQPYGLQDLYAGINAKVNDRVNAQVNYHYMMTAERVADYSRSLGHEVDIQASVKLMKDVTLMGGYSMMFGTNTMDYLKGGDHISWQDWAWLQLNINTRIFSLKW